MAVPRSYKLIIVGAYGLVSSSAFRAATEIDKSTAIPDSRFFQPSQVLAIDQFSIRHTEGSSHGESRITRLAIGEGPEYVTLAERSHAIWTKVEKQVNFAYGNLLNIKPHVPLGGLIIGPQDKEQASYHGAQGFLQQTLRQACVSRVNHQFLTNSELRQAFPQFKFGNNDVGYCEDSMGYINADDCIKANIQLALENGGELREKEKVERFEKLANGKIKVITSKNGIETSYLTEKLIIAAGPWLQNLVKADDLKVCRQTVYWFKVNPESREPFTNKKFPTFIWNFNNQKMVYGFPLMGDADAIKIGSESYVDMATPETVNRNVSEAEIENIYKQLIEPNFNGITSQCVQTKVCLYTVAPKWRFVIDFLPEYGEKIIVASPCSGHGAKHAAAVGEAIAQQSLLGKSDINVMELFGGLLSKPAPAHKLSFGSST